MNIPIAISKDFFNCIPIIITTKRIQNKKHRKKRINKKWLKRYGYTDFEFQDQDAVMIGGKLYMKRSAVERLADVTNRGG